MRLADTEIGADWSVPHWPFEPAEEWTNSPKKKPDYVISPALCLLPQQDSLGSNSWIFGAGREQLLGEKFHTLSHQRQLAQGCAKQQWLEQHVANEHNNRYSECWPLPQTRRTSFPLLNLLEPDVSAVDIYSSIRLLWAKWAVDTNKSTALRHRKLDSRYIWEFEMGLMHQPTTPGLDVLLYKGSDKSAGLYEHWLEWKCWRFWSYNYGWRQ
jgi:hypothetical protein